MAIQDCSAPTIEEILKVVLHPITRKLNSTKLSDKKYKAKPLRRVHIPKPGTGKKRPLRSPTMHDYGMQALHVLLATTDCRNAHLIRALSGLQDIEAHKMHASMRIVTLVGMLCKMGLGMRYQGML